MSLTIDSKYRQKCQIITRAILFPSSYVVRDADPRVVFQIISFPSPDRLSGIFFTGVVLQGMDEIVHGMRDHGGDGPIPTIGYILHAEDVAIDVYPNESRGGLFTFSVAETVLRGTWELMAAYGFYSVHMEIFLGPQAMADYIGQITVQRTESNSTVATAVPAATDT